MMADRIYAEARLRKVIPAIILALLAPGFLLAFVVPDWLSASEDSLEMNLSVGLVYLSIFGTLWVGWCSRCSFAQVFGTVPRAREVRKLLLLGVPLLAISIACIYLVFYPLSLTSPGFVNEWLLDAPPLLRPFAEDEAFAFNLLSMIIVVLLAPVVEELVFRGFFLGRLQEKYGVAAAIAISSLVFALAHVDVLGGIIFSVVLSLIRIKSQSLFAPIIVHVSNNAIVIVITAVHVFASESVYTYTIAEFQSYWWWAPIGALVGLPWLIWYYRRELLVVRPSRLAA